MLIRPNIGGVIARPLIISLLLFKAPLARSSGTAQAAQIAPTGALDFD
jgi:hypothetical protein